FLFLLSDRYGHNPGCSGVHYCAECRALGNTALDDRVLDGSGDVPEPVGNTGADAAADVSGDDGVGIRPNLVRRDCGEDRGDWPGQSACGDERLYRGGLFAWRGHARRCFPWRGALHLDGNIADRTI